MLARTGELPDKPAVADVPLGKGHVVLFAISPMWRHHTHGSFSLLFNELLHFDRLNLFAPETAKPEPAKPPVEVRQALQACGSTVGFELQ